MKIRQKMKKFGPVYVAMDQQGNLGFGETSAPIGQVCPDIQSPAVSLLYSLGSCIALSLSIVASRRKIPLLPFHVEVCSSKAADLPSRFGRFEVSISNEFIEDQDLAKELMIETKSICTVSNTLNAEVEIRLCD